MRDRIPKEEIEKWLSKLKKELKTVKATNNKGKEFLDNINAYIQDCEHFKKEGNLFRSWECCSWSWAYLTIGKDLGLLK